MSLNSRPTPLANSWFRALAAPLDRRPVDASAAGLHDSSADLRRGLVVSELPWPPISEAEQVEFRRMLSMARAHRSTRRRG